MIDPWRRLDLDRRVATERDVKRAYARLLKLHRPEKDPEGFRILHDAYQAALKSLREPSSGFAEWFDDEGLETFRTPPSHEAVPTESTLPLLGEDATPPVSDPDFTCEHLGPRPDGTEITNAERSHDPGHDPDSRSATGPLPPGTDGIPSEFLPESGAPSVPDPLQETARLKRALRSRWKQKRRAFEAAAAAFSAAGFDATRRAGEWRRAAGGEIALLASHMPHVLLVHQILRGEFSLCQEVVDEWQRAAKWKSMSRFAESLLKSVRGTVPQRSAEFMRQLAMRLSIPDPRLADELAGVVYGNFDSGRREVFDEEITEQIWIGKQILGIPRRHRSFWWRLLSHEHQPAIPRNCLGWRILLDAIDTQPIEFWDRVRKRVPADIREKIDGWLATRNRGLPVSIVHIRDIFDRPSWIILNLLLALALFFLYHILGEMVFGSLLMIVLAVVIAVRFSGGGDGNRS
jgi:hypothetical protein